MWRKREEEWEAERLAREKLMSEVHRDIIIQVPHIRIVIVLGVAREAAAGQNENGSH